MPEDYHRHDISDEVWSLQEPLLPGRKRTWGGNARDNRKFINAVFWILRTGTPWRDLPPEYGSWNNVNRRFYRWRDKSVWGRILEALIDDPDYEWLMIDASHIKVHPHASGAVGGSQDMARIKGDSTQRYILPRMHMVCRFRIHITSGTTANCTQACRLVKGIEADCLIADKGCDSDAIVRTAAERGMTVVIPPRSNRKSQREYDKYLYRARHLVDNAFLKLKRWRGITTRYAKYTSSFLAAVQIRCIAIGIEILV